MNNQIVLDEYLLILKSTVEVYVHGTLESSNKDVKELLENSLINILKSQEDTYNLMTSYGYYTINNEDKNVIKTKLNEIKSKN